MTAEQLAAARMLYRHALCHLVQRTAQEVMDQDLGGEPGEELVAMWERVRDARIQLRSALLNGGTA